MRVDELKTLWTGMDGRLRALERPLHLMLRAARAGTLDRTRSKLRLVRAVLRYEVAFGGVSEDVTGSRVAAAAGLLDEVAAFENEG